MVRLVRVKNMKIQQLACQLAELFRVCSVGVAVQNVCASHPSQGFGPQAEAKKGGKSPKGRGKGPTGGPAPIKGKSKGKEAWTCSILELQHPWVSCC